MKDEEDKCAAKCDAIGEAWLTACIKEFVRMKEEKK